MRELFYESIGSNTYLTYKISETDELDTMSLGMLTSNKIPGFAQTSFSQSDLDKFVKFNVSSKVSISEIFSGPINRKRLLGVLNGITDAFISGPEYMIDTDSIILDRNYIFADVQTCETFVICLPLIGDEDSKYDIKEFFRNILLTSQFDPTEPCDHIAKIMNYINSTPQFSFVDFKRVLRELELPGQPVQAAPAAQPNINVQSTSVTSGVNVTRGSKKIDNKKISQKSVTPNFAVPQQQPQQVQKAPLQAANNPNCAAANPNITGKKITAWELATAYTPEKLELYKAQKAAEKAKKHGGKSKDNNSKRGNNHHPKHAANANVGFNVPGNVGFNVPSNVGFAVPNNQNAAANNVNAAKPANNFGANNFGGNNFNQAMWNNAVQKNAPVQQKAVNNVPTYNQAANTFNAAPVNNAPYVKRPSQPGANFGSTTVLNASKPGDTTVLVANQTYVQAPVAKAYLVRMKNNEKVEVNQSPFRIGREASYVHYALVDNTAISASHADIVKRDDKYFLIDRNSRNHTYLNGSLVPGSQEVEIANGDVIRFANEDFEFKIF